MAGETMEIMPVGSPRQSPTELGNAVIAWARSRRGRTLLISAAAVVFFLGLVGARHSETISSISSNYNLPSWRPHMPKLTSIIHSPLKPSNRTLELENGNSKYVPSQLTKETPNFHLVINALQDSPEFCKTTMSAMILNYPPPTVINIFDEFKSQVEREKARVRSTRDYLNNKRLVKDEDLLLIVDGQDTWFQLPSDVTIRQYQNVVADANTRLLDTYGLDANGQPKFKATIIFGAEKTCKGGDIACKYAPASMVPTNLYGSQSGVDTTLTPARFLDSGMMMGPAKDLRPLYQAAVEIFEDETGEAGTAQSVFATLFGEQQVARDVGRKPSITKKITESKWFSYFGGRAGTTTEEKEEKVEPVTANITLQDGHRYEYSMGLDYTNTLFQSALYAAEDELVPLSHDEFTGLSNFKHADTATPPLNVPTALLLAKPPFWTPDLSKHNPSPNKDPSFIKQLAIHKDLDHMLSPRTSWAKLALIQNTYTGAVPAIFHLNLPFAPLKARQARDFDSRTPRIPDVHAHAAPTANLSWSNLWYSGYERALLRNYFRLPQSPIGFHAAAIGGDNMWDQRGGRGGIWTEKEEVWLPWGEVDGVCGTLEQMKRAFGDGKGVWLHEFEDNAEDERRKEEADFIKKLQEDRQKEQERKDDERKKKIEAEKAIADATRQKLKEEQEKKQKAEEAEKKKQEEEERKKQEEEERQRVKEEEQRKKEEEEAKKKKEEESRKKQQQDAKKQQVDKAKTKQEEEVKKKLEEERLNKALGGAKGRPPSARRRVT